MGRGNHNREWSTLSSRPAPQVPAILTHRYLHRDLWQLACVVSDQPSPVSSPIALFHVVHLYFFLFRFSSYSSFSSSSFFSFSHWSSFWSSDCLFFFCVNLLGDMKERYTTPRIEEGPRVRRLGSSVSASSARAVRFPRGRSGKEDQG